MKISYSNYPILKKLSEGLLGVIPIIEVDAPFFQSKEHSGRQGGDSFMFLCR